MESRKVRWGLRITPIAVCDGHEYVDDRPINCGGKSDLQLSLQAPFIGQVEISEMQWTKIYDTTATIIFMYLRNAGKTSVNVRHTSLGSNPFAMVQPNGAVILQFPQAIPTNGLEAITIGGEQSKLEYFLGRSI